jgi:tetratricopeptide (TPR) repeat protein
MKKLLLIIMMMGFAASTLFAQSPKVASAYQYLRDEQPEKAKPEIDAASVHESTKADAKTWFYRGNTYLQLYFAAHMTDLLKKGLSSKEVIAALGEPLSMRRYKKLDNGEKYSYMYELVIYLSNDSVVSWDYPLEKTYKDLDDGNLLQVAYDCYSKTLAIDPDFTKPELSPGSPSQGILSIGMTYSNHAYSKLRGADYKAALENFEKALPIYKGLSKKKELPNLYYYAGISAQYVADTAKAIEYYESAIAYGIKDVNAYMYLANLYLKTGERDKALKIAQKGREMDPTNQDLLITEANIYMQSNESDKAIEVLSEAAKKEPNKADLRYAIGVNYDRMRDDSTLTPEVKEKLFQASVEAYTKAIELKPDYFNAAFNLGALYYNKAADILAEAQNVPYKEVERFEKLKAESKQAFTNSIPHLELAHKIEPKDHNTMIMLRTAYTQTGNLDGFKKIKAELSAE